MIGQTALISVPLQQLIPKGSRVTVFQNIFWVFLVLGTAVGVVVIGYMLWNAYKYRDHAGREFDGDAPELGEIPTGGGKGRKLFLSFGLSAIIVISLIVWTYGTLLFVEGQQTGQAAKGVDVENREPIEVDVVGYRFGWRFQYPNGKTTNGKLVIPQDRLIQLNVTSSDVFHNFGIPAFRVKTDAIPGQTTRTWFVARESGNYTAKCYELCGALHSYMVADVVVMNQSAFQEWYTNDSATNASTTNGSASNASASGALRPVATP